MSIDKEHDEIEKILNKIKKHSFVDGHKVADEEVMGLLVAHYFGGSGLSILKTAYNALEHANFHTDNKIIKKMINKLEVNG